MIFFIKKLVSLIVRMRTNRGSTVNQNQLVLGLGQDLMQTIFFVTKNYSLGKFLS